MMTRRESAEQWLDRLARCAVRMAGKDAHRSSPPTDEIWRDAAGNVLTRNPDGTTRYVMVSYERPMMDAVADVICKSGGSVLNVGFGCGLVDDAIQRRGIARHVIVEAHPQVVGWMREAGWDRRAGVEIVHSAWEDVRWNDYEAAFDGIFFDTYPYRSGTPWDQLLWHECVHKILKPETGVVVMYGVGWKQEAVDQLVRGFWRDQVAVGWASCVVDVPFPIVEWQELGVGAHEVRFPYFSLRPKLPR